MRVISVLGRPRQAEPLVSWFRLPGKSLASVKWGTLPQNNKMGSVWWAIAESVSRPPQAQAHTCTCIHTHRGGYIWGHDDPHGVWRGLTIRESQADEWGVSHEIHGKTQHWKQKNWGGGELEILWTSWTSSSSLITYWFPCESRKSQLPPCLSTRVWLRDSQSRADQLLQGQSLTSASAAAVHPWPYVYAHKNKWSKM